MNKLPRRSTGRTLLRRLAAPLPPGSLPVGAGLVITGVTAYAYLILTARVLGPRRYVPLSVLWATVFVAGPGLFLPLQQEVGRLLAHRRVEGVGGGPVIKRAAAAGAGLVVVPLLALLASAGPIDRHLFDSQILLLIGLAFALIGYLLLSLIWGTVAGAARFRYYAVAQSADGSLRMIVCVFLAMVGVRSAGPYGLVLGLTPIAAALIAFFPNRDLIEPGPPAPWRDLSSALGWLLVGSLGAQVLANGSIIAVKLLAGPNQQTEAGHFLAGLVLARVPLFLFGAVQAALLPRLATYVRSGQLGEFRSGFLRLLILVATIAGVATVGGFVIGPLLVRILFGGRFVLGRLDITLLAAASGAYMLTLAVVQALIALGSHARSAIGWLVGVAVFVLFTSLGKSLLPRIELGFLAGALAALIVSSALLWTKMANVEFRVDPTRLAVPVSELELEP